MKKKILRYSLAGAPIGLTISTVFSIINSFSAGDGNFYPVAPELVIACRSEIIAVVVQTVCSFVYGAAWGGAAVIWEYPKWSLMRKTVTHFVICSTFTFPIAYVMKWMPRRVIGVARYYAVFLAVYLLIWIVQYLSLKKKIEQINKKLRKI